MDRINRLRLTILVGLLSLSMGGTTPGEIQYDQPEVPQHVIDQIHERQAAHKRYMEFVAERERELHNALVEAIMRETGIRDRELGELVTQAIEDASSEFDLDPWLVASLIRVESGGNPNIVSPVGARGLTQIMVATGADIAVDLEIEDYNADRLFEPALNVRMGCYYLRQLLDRFDGSVHAALAAYNWGPNHIARRIVNREALPVVYPSKILKRVPEQPEWVVASAS